MYGGVIPPQDYQALYESGIQAVYGPGTSIPHATCDLVNVEAIERHLQGGPGNKVASKF